ENVNYAQIPYSENDTEAHRKTALKAAQESIVLLKNSNQILPLKRDLKTIAVIGPNANDERVMFGNYNGTPSEAITPLEGIKNKVLAETNVLYTKGCNWVTKSNKLQLVTHNLLFMGEKNGLRAEYFNNRTLSGEPLFVRHDKIFDFNWSKNSPKELKTSEDFSVRWTGKISVPETAKYLFSITADDGFRLYIDNKLVLDSWRNQPLTSMQNEVDMIGSKKYDIKIEYYQAGEDASLKFEYAMVSDYDPFNEAVEIASKSNVVIFFGGISPSLEGEDMPVNFDGFYRGDRTKIDLPAIQDSLLKRLYKTGKPIILVLMSGSALAVNWAEENISAILQTWYPGEEGGNAIADILFGDYNPSGKLPVTFYKSVNQLPPFEDYNMKGRTYKYFEGDVLYPFGFGLSYSTFQYSNLQMPSEINVGDSLIVNIDVRNASSIEGDEVVQLYVNTKNSNYTVPIRSLQGFQRLHLKDGETKKITFVLKPKQMSLVDNNGNRRIEPGTLTISVGSGQPGLLQKFNIASVSSKLEMKGKFLLID
ncbi:MAG: glycoside hydrolase family 3 C-terminal domain-containing protein, partial [Leadbetterella sp.]|nr:glycoside hydrolase family 3 C-terminal domain-containing protein [Leadbetterella sp.]